MFKCAICTGVRGERVLEHSEPDRFEKSVGVKADGYHRYWVQCERCGFVSNQLPQISIDKLVPLRGSYYEVDFANSNISDKYNLVMNLPDSESDNAGRVSRVVHSFRRWLPTKTHPRVLDIGAGTGVFLSRLIDQTDGDWRCLGVEPDPQAAAHLRSLQKFDVLEDLFLGQAELSGYNLVTLNKILEHIPDPISFLRTVAGALSEDGSLIYIEVPDKITLQLRRPEDNILGSLHCHLYDPMSLARVAREAGIEILEINRISEPSGKLTVYAVGTITESLVKLGEYTHE